MTEPHHQRVLIVDYGSQVTQLIARRVRESGVYCEVHPYDKVGAAFLQGFAPAAVILSGGPASVHEAESPQADPAVFALGVPVLGVCYGEMAICQALGGAVEGGQDREFGRADIVIQRDSPLLAGLGEVGAREPVWMSHGDKIVAVPDGFVVVATSEGSPFAVIADEARRIYGLHEAIGEQLTCVFVDTGLLRAGEADQVVSLFRGHYNIPLIHVDAGDDFLGALKGVSDPETKRKTIGRLFIEVFDREAAKIDGAEFLAQGTLYPDVIESVSVKGGPSHVIKSHHNVGGLPDTMTLKLVEPLRELFKDEVRALGRELGLDPAFVGRHPFPGPGLAIRIPGEVSAEKVEVLQKADLIWLDEIRKAGLYDTIWQAFAVLLPVKTVGVMGDARTYEDVCALRAVVSTDGMTADFYEFPWAVLGRAATRIVNEVRGINRVVYDVTSKPPGTIEWE
jgi:GMP synthase (glutamine-hydrolysing)